MMTFRDRAYAGQQFAKKLVSERMLCCQASYFVAPTAMRWEKVRR